MCLQKFLKINNLLKSELKDNFDLIISDLSILNHCRDNDESIYSLSTKYNLDRRSLYKRLDKLEDSGFIDRSKTTIRKKKIINLTKKAYEALLYFENLENTFGELNGFITKMNPKMSKAALTYTAVIQKKLNYEEDRGGDQKL